jgi:hypothetical protein
MGTDTEQSSYRLFGAAIVPGFNTTSDGRNDDGTWMPPSGGTNARQRRDLRLHT